MQRITAFETDHFNPFSVLVLICFFIIWSKILRIYDYDDYELKHDFEGSGKKDSDVIEDHIHFGLEKRTTS